MTKNCSNEMRYVYVVLLIFIVLILLKTYLIVKTEASRFKNEAAKWADTRDNLDGWVGGWF